MRARTRISGLVAVMTAAAVAALLALPASSIAASTYTVNTTADNAPNLSECSGAAGDCSTRQALDKSVSGDMVVIPANATAYQVTGTPIPIPGGVTITGGGASGTTVTGGGANQIFTVSGGGTVSISAITLTAGHNPSLGDEAGALWVTNGNVNLDQVAITNSSSPEWGGAIEDNGGNLTITRSRFTGDTAGTQGGGAIDYYASGTLVVTDTVFASDTSQTRGGAVTVESSPTYTFNRVTFAGDSIPSSASGGGGALETFGTGVVYNTTFSGNSASRGGALYVDTTSPRSTTAVNDTFAGNSSATGANVDVAPGGAFSTQNSIFATPQGGGSCAGTVTDASHNLEDAATSTCGFTTAMADIVGQSAQLASTLADNGNTVATAGGPPQTLALGATSPALHTASATGCQTVGSIDERNQPRPGTAATGCDMGAFELQTPALPGRAPAITSPATATFKVRHAGSFAVTTTGSPTPTLSETGFLPSGLKLTNNGNGTATLTGTPASGTAGTYKLTIVATNGVSPSATQVLSIIVKPGPKAKTKAPKLSALKINPSSFEAATNGGAIISEVGGVVSYKDSLAAATVFKVYAIESGNKLVLVGSFIHQDRKGQNKFRFSGRVHGHSLGVGNYVLKATATKAGKKSRTLAANFQILAPPPTCSDPDNDSDCDPPVVG